MRDAFPDRTDDQFLQSMLASVNEYRAKHGAPPITLDPELTTYAKSRAALASTEEGLSRGHEGLDERYGENLSWAATTSAHGIGPATGATEAWYGEIADYNFDDPAASDPSATGHFTQLVWNGSTKIGAGRVFGQDGQWWETYIALNFSPPGNMQGDYPANVNRPKS